MSEHTGTTAVEKALRPVVSKKVEILNGVGIEDAPALKGYVRFIAKPTSDTILKIDQDQPLLVRWQYGLGRAVVFTSDAKSRWAADWVAWKGFDKFWANVFRDLLAARARPARRKPNTIAHSGDVIVNYQLGRDVGRTAKSSGHLCSSARMDFNIRSPSPNSRTKAIVEGFMSDRPKGCFGSARSRSRALFPKSASTGRNRNCWIMDRTNSCCAPSQPLPAAGTIPAPSKSSMPQGRSQASVLQLWPGLLGIAILLNLAELIMRKGRALFQRS